MTKRYMSVSELAEYIGCTATAVRQRVKRGNLPFIKFGRSIRFDQLDIDRHMAAHKVRVARRERKAS